MEQLETIESAARRHRYTYDWMRQLLQQVKPAQVIGRSKLYLVSDVDRIAAGAKARTRIPIQFRDRVA